MELLLFRHEEFEKLYNCSYDIEQVPLEARTHTIVGISLIVLFVIFEMAYMPCILAIYKLMKSSSCYKLMFYIAVCDVLCLPITGLVTGYFAITGAVYCTHPILIYVLGSIAPELWYAESFAAVLLALNRCLTINYPDLARVVFDGRRTWYILVVPTLYTIWIGVFFKSAFFSGILCSWFYNPHIGYLDGQEDKYTNIMHPIHNWSMAIAMVTLYSSFCGSIFHKLCKTKRVPGAKFHLSNSQKKLFLQVLVISVIHTFTAVIYDVMQLVRVTETWTISAQYAWVFAHGAPGIIYLLFNETIRRECRSYLGCKNDVAPSPQQQENDQGTHYSLRTIALIAYRKLSIKPG